MPAARATWVPSQTNRSCGWPTPDDRSPADPRTDGGMGALRCETVAVDFRLRRATAEDAEGVAQVYVASWNKGFAHLLPPRVLDREQVARWERDLDTGPSQWWLAESRTSVIGFAGTGPSRHPLDPDLGELDTVAVTPSAWRHGLGRRLMD